MEAKLFRIHLVTNLHVGSGETNFNFIDNQVQRDPISEYPTIHSSGLKGALREYYRGEDEENNIFGREGENASQGKVSFIEGKLLAIPVRSNKKSYFLGTTIELIKEYIKFSNLFGKNIENIELDKLLNGKKACIFENKESGKGIVIEGIESNEIEFSSNNELKNKLEKIIGATDIVIIKEEIFKEEIAKRLPIIARNKLENGESIQLWYEEVVPRESIFYTGIINSQNFNKGKFEDFGKKLQENLIQIGANATIGYGLTKFVEVK